MMMMMMMNVIVIVLIMLLLYSSIMSIMPTIKIMSHCILSNAGQLDSCDFVLIPIALFVFGGQCCCVSPPPCHTSHKQPC